MGVGKTRQVNYWSLGLRQWFKTNQIKAEETSRKFFSEKYINIYKRHICNTYVSILCGIRSCPSKFLVFGAMIAFLSFSLVMKFITGVCKKVLPGYRTPYQEYTVHTNLITPKTLGYCMIWSYPKIVLRLTALSTNYFFHR